ncbi:MAG: hypothetical protein HUJ73_08860 [Eubacterium sp.]|nr:hypothetical protein [Eubacterium sp.]
MTVQEFIAYAKEAGADFTPEQAEIVLAGFQDTCLSLDELGTVTGGVGVNREFVRLINKLPVRMIEELRRILGK